MRCLALLLVLLALSACPAFATTYLVKPDGTGDYPTIQEAIDGASNGDVIELDDGVFVGQGNKELNLRGLTITLRSQSGDPHSCTIDCEQSGRGIHFSQDETPETIIDGICIRNGFPDLSGGAIRCAGAAPTLINCIFKSCASPYSGGAVYCYADAEPTFLYCAFVDNYAPDDGGAVRSSDSWPILDHCTFVGNGSPVGAQVYCHSSGTTELHNCILAFGSEDQAVACNGGDATLVCCDIFGHPGGDWAGCVAAQLGMNGNISVDPLFCLEANPQHPYALHGDSPCGPLANPDCGLIGKWDIGCSFGSAACCFGDICDFMAYEDCVGGGGTWMGAGTTCSPNPCPQIPIGVCCIDAECSLLTEAECSGAGGEWDGGSEICDPNPCDNLLTVRADGTGEFPTIQSAINAAGPGDIVALADGVFSGEGNRDMQCGYSPVVMRSLSGVPEQCVINCGGSPAEHHRAFRLFLGEPPELTIEGITIQNGYADTEGGGAIYIGSDSQCSLRNCRLVDNHSDVEGGAILCAGEGVVYLAECVLLSNSAAYGGALRVQMSAAAYVDSCVFMGNSGSVRGGAVHSTRVCRLEYCLFRQNSSAQGGAILSSHYGVRVFNCTLDQNHSVLGSGIYSRIGAGTQIERTIITSGSGGLAVDCDSDAQPTILCTDIWGNSGGDWEGDIQWQLDVEGNISEDPLYCDSMNPGSEYSLQSASPCAPAYSGECGLIGAFPVGCGIFDVEADGSGMFSTIQEALDAAVDGVVVELGDGVYAGDGNRDLCFFGKLLTLRSASGDPFACVVDCGGSSTEPHRGLVFLHGEGPNTRVEGLGFVNGEVSDTGGCVLCDGSSPVLTNCAFWNNIAYSGGAMSCHNSAAPTIEQCTFHANTAYQGGAVYSDESDLVLANVTIVDNTAIQGSGLYFTSGSATVDHSIVTHGSPGAAVKCAGSVEIVVECSDIHGNYGGDWTGCIEEQLATAGNISLPPLYCDQGEGDFTLREDSPCAAYSEPNPECDQIGAWPIGCASMAIPDARSAGMLALHRISPNPLSGPTEIVFELPAAENEVTLALFDVTGRQVRTLILSYSAQGPGAVHWDGRDDAGRAVPTGIYHCRLRAGQEELTRRVVVIR